LHGAQVWSYIEYKGAIYAAVTPTGEAADASAAGKRRVAVQDNSDGSYVHWLGSSEGMADGGGGAAGGGGNGPSEGAGQGLTVVGGRMRRYTLAYRLSPADVKAASQGSAAIKVAVKVRRWDTRAVR
jgi:hypothetical protein